MLIKDLTIEKIGQIEQVMKEEVPCMYLHNHGRELGWDIMERTLEIAKEIDLLPLHRQRQRVFLQMRNGRFKNALKEENQTRVSFALAMIGTLKQRALPLTKRKVNGSSIFMNSILPELPLKG